MVTGCSHNLLGSVSTGRQRCQRFSAARNYGVGYDFTAVQRKRTASPKDLWCARGDVRDVDITNSWHTNAFSGVIIKGISSGLQ
ncbi:MAG: hypothetical protein GPOALKHO_001915 [Sodalis sp.]|nr:MAG: hypothetical protein GPOALKHO_001915 [Sodalis sp.]